MATRADVQAVLNAIEQHGPDRDGSFNCTNADIIETTGLSKDTVEAEFFETYGGPTRSKVYRRLAASLICRGSCGYSRAVTASGGRRDGTSRNHELLPSPSSCPAPLAPEVRQAYPKALVASEASAAVAGP